MEDQVSPKGSTAKPVRLSMLIIREGADEPFSRLVDKQLDHHEWQAGGTIVHENIVSQSESNVEGRKEGDSHNQHDFSIDGEMQEGVD